MPTWNLVHAHDWTPDTATAAGAAGSTTGAADGGKWTDVSGGRVSVAAAAVGSLSALHVNSDAFFTYPLAYDPAVRYSAQRVVLRVPPQASAGVADIEVLLRYDSATNSAYYFVLTNSGGTALGGNLYVVTNGGLTTNYGLVMPFATLPIATAWCDLEVTAVAAAGGGTDLSFNLYSATGAADAPASGTLLGTGTHAADAQASLQGASGYGLSAVGSDVLVARVWLYQGDTSETFTTSPTSLVTGVAGQTLVVTGVNSAWSGATTWTFDGGTITNVSTASATLVTLTVTGGASAGTFTLSDGVATASVTLSAPGPITPGTGSVVSFGPSAIVLRTTAPSGGAGRVRCDLYGSAGAFFAPPAAGTLVAADVTPGADATFAPPAGSKPNDVWYFTWYYHDGTSTPVTSAQVQSPVGYAPHSAVAVGTSITSEQSTAIGSAVSGVCGPITFSVNNQGVSGSTASDWLKSDPNSTGHYAGLVTLIHTSSYDCLWYEMGTNDTSAAGTTEAVYQAFRAQCRQFLTDLCADCPTLTQVMVNGIPYDYRPAADLAAATIDAAEAARRVANVARFQSLPADLSGVYTNATARAGTTTVYGLTAADSTLIQSDHVHPTTACFTLVQQEYAAAYRDAFVAPVFVSSSVVAPGSYSPPALATVYCSDEHVAVRACGDFAQLVPSWQSLAHGTDGVFTGADRWTLTSASVDFEAQGLRPGHVLLLTLRGTFAPSGDAFAVALVSGGSVTLRRVGKAAGVGQPPSPAAGLTGVGFSCSTLDPQIEDASYEVNHLEGVDPSVANRAPSDLYDPRELCQFTVLTVLRRQYENQVSAPNTSYALKLAQTCADWTNVRGRLVLKWGSKGEARNPTSFLSGRTTR